MSETREMMDLRMETTLWNTGEGGVAANPRAYFAGREAIGLIAQLAPFFQKESLTPRELRILLELLLIQRAPGDGEGTAMTPELDLTEDTAELWLTDDLADTALRFSWALEKDPDADLLPLPHDETERLLSLLAYLAGCPEDPARDALIKDCEARLGRVTHTRVRQIARRAGVLC